MEYVLAPNDEGIIVTLKEVAEADKPALDKAKVNGFDPTVEPFDKYYDYSKSLGFFVNRAFFDHAEHKGRRLDYSEYVKLMTGPDEIVTDSVKDMDSGYKYLLEEIKSLKPVNNTSELTQALRQLKTNLGPFKHMIDTASEKDKQLFHELINASFKLQQKALMYVVNSDFDALRQLSELESEVLNMIGDLQGKLREKYNENF